MPTRPARCWEPFPPKEVAEELRRLLFFHLCSPRSPLLQQRTHQHKAKGTSPPHFGVEEVEQILLHQKGEDCVQIRDACCTPSSRMEKTPFKPPPSAQVMGKRRRSTILPLSERRGQG